MSTFANLFSGVNFQSTIRRYCGQVGWKIYDSNSSRVILKFDMNSGRTQTLFIIRYDSTLEFSVPSLAKFDSVDDIPHYLSTLLLKRSSERKIGFWCVEQIGEKEVYSHMHNAEISLIDVNYFAKVTRALINECDDFETTLQKMLN